MPAAGSLREPVTPAFISWGDIVTEPDVGSGELRFDAVLSEEHESTAEVTDYSVEQGVAVVDHVRPNPNRLRLEVFVSNTPVFSPDASLQSMPLDLPQSDIDFRQVNVIGNLANPARAGIDTGLFRGAQVAATVLQFAGDTDYVAAAESTLTTLKDTATLLSVITPHKAYFNMVLERVVMHRDQKTGTSANISLHFREIRIVSSQIVAAPLPTIPRAVPTVDKGKKDADVAPPPKQSVLLKKEIDVGSAPATAP
jgi:hypothetical protein